MIGSLQLREQVNILAYADDVDLLIAKDVENRRKILQSFVRTAREAGMEVNVYNLQDQR